MGARLAMEKFSDELHRKGKDWYSLRRRREGYELSYFDETSFGVARTKSARLSHVMERKR
jgi:hypothetical protein